MLKKCQETISNIGLNTFHHMKNKSLSLILFDFDGVLSNGRFYSQLKDSSPSTHQEIIRYLFSKESWPLISDWMRGKFSYEDIHNLISTKVGKEVDWLNDTLVESVKNMPLNEDLVNFAARIRKSGVKTAVFTDNMDIFDRIFVEHSNLLELFDYVFSSADFGKLKLDDGAEFFKHALNSSGCSDGNFLFLDDSIKLKDLTESLGGTFYHYNKYSSTQNAFEEWFEEMYSQYVS
jgi:FMN phosphatase YigB (HAD superfamily)